MKNMYHQATALLRCLGLTALLAGGATLAAHAQFGYTPAQSSNVSGTYTDLGTNGTAISTNGNYDDANSAAQGIGFTFNYNGTAFTQFVLNTNGLLRLGANGPSSALAASPYAQQPEAGPINSTNSADTNLLMPFNFDLTAGTSTPEYRVYTSGTAPNRICTIQWKNVADKAVATDDATPATISTQYTNMAFQVKLYETTNTIEFVYNSTTVGAAGATALKYAVVGIKGSTSSASVLGTKVSSSAWSTTTFTTGPQLDIFTANAHNFRSTFPPDAGRTYRLVPAAANDASVAVYTLGKLPRTVGLPHNVQARVTNLGTSTLSALQVSLAVTGANTFNNVQTVASLAAGNSTIVTFAPMPTTIANGVNTVTVTIPNDDNASNNTSTVQQTVSTTNTFSYVPTNQTTTSTSSLGAQTTASGLAFANKHTLKAAGSVTSVSAYLQDTKSVGRIVYGAVMSPTGTVLARSADYTVLATDIDTYKTFTFTSAPAIAANGSFLAALVQAPSTNTTAFFPIGYQTESPVRSDAYFIASPTGANLTDLSTLAGAPYRFMIEANITPTASATSKELERAITVYPNPSETGVFTLNALNAKASAGLGVEVTDQLGRRVYTGKASDNFANTLDLSNLAPGIYHLTVRNGSDFTSSKISIGR